MSKSITIPSDRGSRITVNINGVEYVYAAGATVEVPDEVAAAIENALAEKPVAGRKAHAPLNAPKRKGSATGIDVIVDDNGNLYIDAGDIPSDVVANPTLAGTESDLTGLQVGETKYKVSGGSGGGATICECTYADGTITSSMTAAAMMAACQSGPVTLQYSLEDGGATVNMAEIIISAYTVSASNTIVSYVFSTLENELTAESGTDYPSGGGK